MKLFKTKKGVMVQTDGCYLLAPVSSYDELINRDDLYYFLSKTLSQLPQLSPIEIIDLLEDENILPPIGQQEVWAAGVTYKRSRQARIEEATESGGGNGDFYAKVYEAERPELFFKSNPSRVVGHKAGVRIRKDSTWNVPEPELTLFITSNAKIVAYTVGNDMSSRSIEGENPLYLPQAKMYEKCAALGPCLYVPEQPISPDAIIHMQIKRSGEEMYNDSVSIKRMKRKHDELSGFLFREFFFPHGVFLMTGTCLVPSNEFTLQRNDEIIITIDNIGTLINYVE